MWLNIKARCYNEKNNRYSSYGGRGIKVCEEWHDSSKFIKWALNNGFEAKEGTRNTTHTIERNDVEKDYCPENCKFVPLEDQHHNKQLLSVKNTSGYRGVSVRTGRSVASIVFKGERVFDKSAKTPKKAALLRELYIMENDLPSMRNFPELTIEEVLKKFSAHSRIEFGFISSMVDKNMNKIIEGIKTAFSQCLKENFDNFENDKNDNKKYDEEVFSSSKMWVFNQDDHIKLQSKTSKPHEKEEFVRSMDKIMKKTGMNFTNILFLEAEEDKISEVSKSRDNTVFVPYFVDENFFKASSEDFEKKKDINSEFIDRIIKEIVDECKDDIRINIRDFNVNKKYN
jgi:hypothetical protein